MKKNMMKLLAMALSIVMMVSLFAGCDLLDKLTGGSKSAKEDSIVGEWEGDWDFSSFYNTSIDAAGDATMSKHLTVDELNITMCYEFNKDGTYSFYVDEDALQDTLDSLKTQVTKGMRAYFEEVLGGAGMDVDEVLAAQGMDLEAMVDEILNVDSLFDPDDMSEEGYYKFEDGKLYTSEEEDEFDDNDYCLCKLKGDKITLDVDEDAELDDMMREMLPLTLERK